MENKVFFILTQDRKKMIPVKNVRVSDEGQIVAETEINGFSYEVKLGEFTDEATTKFIMEDIANSINDGYGVYIVPIES